MKTENTTEKADKGATHVVNRRLPDSVLIKRPKEQGVDVVGGGASPADKSNQPIMIIDNRNNSPVKVSLIDGIGLTPDTDGRLIFIESNVIHDVMSVEVSRAHFAVKKDGSVIYGQQGFDDVAGADFDMVDIVKLIEFNNSGAGVAATKKLDDESNKVESDRVAEVKKVADKKEADRKAGDVAVSKAAKAKK